MACNVLTGADACVAELAGDAFASMAKSLAESSGWAMKNLMTVWLKAPTPDVLASNSPAAWLTDRTSGLILAAAFVAVLWAAYRMAMSGTFDHLADLGWALGKLVLVTGCVSAATTLGLQIGDAYSTWMLTQTPSDFGLFASLGAWSPGVVMIVAVVVIVTQLVQVILMLVKNAMVILLVGFLPLTAAATNTPLGRGGFHKALTWLGAFVLYKPVCVTIYAVALRMSNKDQSISGQLSGVALMILAVVALPALMRFLVPVTAAVSGGNAGAIAGATVGATIATGAVVAAGVATGGAGFSAAPAALPTGAALGSAPSGAGAATTDRDREAAA
jgi:type IV secretion system protein TrbL